MHALILAAGKGTRLRPYTEQVAKPALPFLNIPLLGYPLFNLEQSGLTHLTINMHHCPDSIESTFTHLNPSPGYEVFLSHEQDEVLGSGGAITFAKDSLKKDNKDGYFIYANGDEVLLFNHDQYYKPLIEAHKKSGGMATMMLCYHPEVGSKFNGVWLNENKEVLGFNKTPIEDSTTGLHFTGVMVISTEIFKYLPKKGFSNILHDGLIPAIQDGLKVFGYEEKNLAWFETGDPQSFLEATRLSIRLLFDKKATPQQKHLLKLLQHHYPDSSKSAQFFLGRASDGLSQLNDSLLILGDRVQISPNVTLKGFNVIGDDCHIGEGVTLENCVLGPKLPPLINCQLRNELRF